MLAIWVILFVILSWAPVGFLSGIVLIGCGAASYPSQDDMEKAILGGYASLVLAILVLGATLPSALLGFKKARFVNSVGIAFGVHLRSVLDAAYRYRKTQKAKTT